MSSTSKIILNRPHLTYEEGKGREWVIGNGLGGYASSTVIGLNTRKYHGLLVASLEPPVRRWLLLSKIEEAISRGEDTYLLSTNSFGDTIYPNGHIHQARFCFDAFPTFTYSIGDITLEKSVFMPHGYNATFISYRVENPGKPFTLRLRPLVSSRDFHSNLYSSGLEWTFKEKAEKKTTELTPYFEGAPTLILNCDNAKYLQDAFWVYNMFYEMESARGTGDREDLYSPGEFVSKCKEGTTTLDIVAIGGIKNETSKIARRLFSIKSELLEREKERSESIGKRVFKVNSMPQNPSIELLTKAADSFIVNRDSTHSKSILAGYHWFSDWGRDAMISLPGITLTTARFEEAKGILGTFARSTKDGLVPNRFPDSGGTAEYNSADASLWFFIAVHKFLEYTGSYGFVMKELWATMEEIVESYKAGTHFDIHMTEDGLISAGSGATQLTWMDAKVGDTAITPRHGKAVEINALWYNALRIMEKLAPKYGEDPKFYKELAERTKKSFNKKFWNSEQGCLYDVISDEWKDASIRPNQIFAISLPYTLLDEGKARKVLLKVMEELYTPYGLRSLSPKDGRYKGTYGGGQGERDSAYHQGTAWAWLMGPFITAYVRVNGGDRTAKKKAAKLVSPILNHLREAGIGTISEIFDGDPPFVPRGCISQAWSVGEILRCVVEDI